MKTFTSLVAAMLLLSTSLFAQSPVRGKVAGEIRETNGKALPFATVLLLKAKDSTLVKGAITSETGYYEVENVPEGSYLIGANMVGFQKTYSAPFSVSATTSTIQVPALQMTETSQTLDEVKVISKKPFGRAVIEANGTVQFFVSSHPCAEGIVSVGAEVFVFLQHNVDQA